MEPQAKPDFYQVQHRHTRQCRREALWVAAVWLGTLLVCGSIFAALGYPDAESRVGEPPLLFGIPAWVALGLFAPWLVVILITWFFAAFVLRDDEPYVPFPARPSADHPSTEHAADPDAERRRGEKRADHEAGETA